MRQLDECEVKAESIIRGWFEFCKPGLFIERVDRERLAALIARHLYEFADDRKANDVRSNPNKPDDGLDIQMRRRYAVVPVCQRTGVGQ